ncbi:MAG: DUF1574 domain-containing protein [Treponema sp.]|jgi:hypothetical protein|nr:DUF1574 domain-containing protein [Treponema sp.]
MAVFLKRMALFLAIFLVLFTGTGVLVVRMAAVSGELTPLDEMIERQLEDNVLVGSALAEIIPWYKFRMAVLTGPDILVVGTSRALYIKQEHFLPETKFYNAATAAQNFPAYRNFIESLGRVNTRPRHIILNLDQWQFNRNYFDQPMAKTMRQDHDYNNGYVYGRENIIRGFYRLLLSGEYRPALSVPYPGNMGLAAAVYGDGFRKDGFYVWTRKIISEAYRAGAAYTDFIPHVESGRDMFAFGDGIEIYGESVQEVEKILALCREKGIMVTAFFPPFAPSFYRLLAESGRHEYMTGIYPVLLPLFEKYGFELYDFTGSSVIDDTMTYDGYHPDDRGSHRILLFMKAHGSVLADCIAEE